METIRLMPIIFANLSGQFLVQSTCPSGHILVKYVTIFLFQLMVLELSVVKTAVKHLCCIHTSLLALKDLRLLQK